MKIFIVRLNENLKRVEFFQGLRVDGVFEFHDVTTSKDFALTFNEPAAANNYIRQNKLTNYYAATVETIGAVNWSEVEAAAVLHVVNRLHITKLKMSIAADFLAHELLKNQFNYFLKLKNQEVQRWIQ